MGKSTISMAIFNSYVSLPEGMCDFLGAGPEDRLHLHSLDDATVLTLRRGEIPAAGSDLPILWTLSDTDPMVLCGTTQGDPKLPEA